MMLFYQVGADLENENVCMTEFTGSTLIDLLEFRALQTPLKAAFIFNDESCSYLKLWQQVNGVAGHLQLQGVRSGDRVVIVLPNGAEFFFSFYGVQRAGAVAIPIFPKSGPKRVFDIARKYEVSAIIIPVNAPQAWLSELRSLSHESLWIITNCDDATIPPDDLRFPAIQPDDTAFIQNTSGSTGPPKGVLLSHHNLLTNVQQMIRGMEITDNEVFVSWLPVYHDMGLILMTMVPLYLAAQVILLPADLKNVVVWLHAIQKYQGTFTAAPDFAYRLCLRHVQNPAVYDLSSLRVALNAAEVVRHQTVSEFEQYFGLNHVMTAGYGLAEATVGVSMSPPGAGIRVDDEGLVSVGQPFPDVDIKILDKGRLVGPDTIGEVLVKSMANSSGYFANPDDTVTLFWANDYILTGDLGYLDEEGFLYIVGRKKNVIKLAGQTIFPQEIEAIIDNHEAVRYSAAVGIDEGGTQGEQVYVFAEVRSGDVLSEENWSNIVIDIVQSIYASQGYRPGAVCLLKEHAIPLTHNGKLQHSKLKEQFLSGTLVQRGFVLFRA